MIPLSDCAEALELLALVVNITGNKLLAELSELYYRDIGRAADTGFLSGFKLCGQSVGIPTGNKRSLEACHIFVTNNKVL